MYAPPCSWRTGTNWTLEAASDSLRSSVSSPGIPNTYSTPSDSRHSTNTSDALRSAMPAPYPLAHRIAQCAALALAVLALLASPGRAASSFFIRGGGDGHGIGMSQYGA